MAEPYLRMENIRKSFPGVQALKGITFDANQGEILALIGANGAGKSTLMNVLGGNVIPDEGKIVIGGCEVKINSPLDAAKNGVAFVHQEMAMLPTMSIVDTMFISTFPTNTSVIDYKTANERCGAVLKRLGCNFDPGTKIRNISPGSQQMVEIGRALLSDPKIIIFDEPTSSLTSREKEHLFEIINSLKQDGAVIIYISHMLDEVFQLCDRAMVLRNGETVGGGMIKDLTYDDIVKLMIGSKQIDSYFEYKQRPVGDPVLTVKKMCRKGVLDNISFTLCKGEVVGLWGLLGSGRTEVARALAGLDSIDSGEIQVCTNGHLHPVKQSEMKNSVGMVTENRREEGLLLPMSVKHNMSLANLWKLTRGFLPFIQSKLEQEQTQKYVDRLEIKVANHNQRVETLSGGNQQKVIIGRWLQKNPLIYIMDEPTRGLDVGAKADIRKIIAELAESGAAILVISSEIDEMMSVSDRYLVMNRGRIVAELSRDATKEKLMAAAAGAQ
ncbi:ABC-type sugar transport system, ATPase component [Longilinea arvoryzae]|uniref:ABC-type sugar transport system, ATPase component n=1 Tax=Longilinea arvoryzae TaxID=360412 RepID=A0A0S7BGJ8_9CHLR|nr:sugar ABC transporter ATP-binding protein [Longilinea arvoryzae]GAP13138.1 ABC-type sugar transport system, ATPase component [Longilinea arvoryzae]